MSTSEILISTDKVKLDIDFIHNYLSKSYWAKGIPKSVVERSIKNSLCFGIYKENIQIGFARVITDFATFAYLADVFIDENQRGNGLGKELINAIVTHKELIGVKRWHLLTDDAQGLYKQYGFSNPADPSIHMEKRQEPSY